MLLHRSFEQLEAGLATVRQSPRDRGRAALLVCRPAENEREVLEKAVLDVNEGLIGDRWSLRTGGRRQPSPDRQLTVMNARAIDLIAVQRDRWPLAGDQLYIDLDLSADNLPAGTRLEIGSAIIEVTAPPHRGCAKFRERFGVDALKLVNSAVGVALNLRGINAKVVQSGVVHSGDPVKKA